jgi:hypothetical protein
MIQTSLASVNIGAPSLTGNKNQRFIKIDFYSTICSPFDLFLSMFSLVRQCFIKGRFFNEKGR